MTRKKEAEQHLDKAVHKRVVMKVTFNSSVSLLNKDELFSLFNVDRRFQGFPLQVDGKLITDPCKIIAAENAIYSMEVNEGLKRIVIISRDYQKAKNNPIRKSTNEIYIK